MSQRAWQSEWDALGMRLDQAAEARDDLYATLPRGLSDAQAIRAWLAAEDAYAKVCREMGGLCDEWSAAHHDA
jgi:hypothetical protein